MKDLGHHMNHVQKKVVAYSRKNSSEENKSTEAKKPEVPPNSKKKEYLNP